MDICLFGNGDLLAEFQIKSEIERYSNLSKDIDVVLNETSASDSGRLAQIGTTADQFDSTIITYIEGNNSQPDSSLTDNENPLISIENYTKWTDHSIPGSYQNSQGSCQISKDEWKFSLNSCTKTLKWQSSNANVFSLGQDICIDIRNFDSVGILQRYDSTSTCSNGVLAQITSYFTALKKYDNSRTIVFTDVKNDLQNFKDKNDALITEVSGLVTKIKTVKTDLDKIFDQIAKEPEGLIYSVNCKFLVENSQRMLDSMCVGFLSPTYVTVTLLIAVSMLSLFASFITYFKALDAAKKLNSKDLYHDYEMGAGKMA